MSGITGFGWFIIITVALFLFASIRVIGLGTTIMAVTGLLLWFVFARGRL
jgi:hypothetical protein